MNCPACGNVNLTMSERQGIEIDYCPNCRGVWLDRGELDKIIDRSAGGPTSQQTATRPPDQQTAPRYSDSYQSGHHNQSGHYKKKKKEGFLSDLFDFD